MSVLLGHGDGTFRAQTTSAVGSQPDCVVAADVNGDGKVDLVTSNKNSNNISVLLGNGDGTFQPQMTQAIGRAPSSIVATDVNGDGQLDLVAATGSNTLSVLLGNGNGTFQAQTTLAVGSSPASIVAADVNGDGRPDLVTANAGSNTVSVLVNAPPVPAALDPSSLSTSTGRDTGLAVDASAPVLAITGVSGAVNLIDGHVVSGTIDPADAGRTVSVYDGASLLGTAASDARGNFSLRFTETAPGTGHSYSLTATATDAAGNSGTSGGLLYSLDFTANQPLFGTVAHDTSSPLGEVFALYEGLLERAPDQPGATHWTGQLQAGESLPDVTQAFLNSGEGQTHLNASGNAGFVGQLYQTVLGRQADANGQAYWTGQLDSGVSRASVADDFVFSAEHLQELRPGYSAGVYLADETDAGVARLYYGLLDRAPDGGGLQNYAAMVHAGTGLSSIAQDMLGSTEYAGQHPTAPTNTQFVDSLYTQGLGRTADANGEQHWLAQLSAGMSRADVATSFMGGAEAQAHLAGRIEQGWQLA